MNSTLKADPIEATGQVIASEGQPPSSTSNAGDSDHICGAGRSFRWSSDAVRRLCEDVEWALTSNPTGTAEVAGVLLGKISPTTEITDCRPVFLMRPRDHAYALTGPGKREFERVTAEVRSLSEDGGSVIGFYHSYIGGGFDLTEEDLGLIRTCLPDSGQVVLLIKLTAQESTSVRLFVGDQCHISCDFHSSEDASGLPRWLELWHSLSPDVHPLKAGPEDTTESVDLAEPAVMPAPHPVPIRAIRGVQEDFVELKPRSNRTPPFILVAAIILTALIGYSLFDRAEKLNQGTDNSRPAAVQVGSTGSRASRFVLRAERHGDNIRLDWDRTAPVLASATGGMLTIRQVNRREKEVLVDGNRLRAGSVLYGPVHGNASFRLVILGQNGTELGESVTNYRQQTSR